MVGGGEGEGVGDVMDGHALQDQYVSGRDWGRVVLDSIVVSMLWNGDFPKDEPDRVR